MAGKDVTPKPAGGSPTTKRVKRAAHRPSRREVVVEAAMHLYSVRSIEDVTVADIAAEAEMTSAAVYYHYPSKDEVLLGGLRMYAEGLLDELRAQVDSDAVSPLGDIIVRVLEWTDEHRAQSLVYFVRSPGWSVSIEALRRQVRLTMLSVFTVELRKRHGVTTRAKQGAAATALSSLLEVSASSWLTEDAVLANLGRRRFSEEVRELAADICSL